MISSINLDQDQPPTKESEGPRVYIGMPAETRHAVTWQAMELAPHLTCGVGPTLPFGKAKLIILGEHGNAMDGPMTSCL